MLAATYPPQPNQQNLLSVLTRTLPRHWALFLIYGDQDGLPEQEVLAIDAWFHKEFGAYIHRGDCVECVDVRADYTTTAHHDAQATVSHMVPCCSFIFHVIQLKEHLHQ